MQQLVRLLALVVVAVVAWPALGQEAAPEPQGEPVAAPEESAPPAPDAAPPAPDAAPPAPEAPPLPAREPAVGDEIGGWKVLALTGQKRLPDGRPTDERCGWLRDAVVERGPRVERVLVEVPCVIADDASLSPGAARLRFEQGPPPLEAAPAKAPEPMEELKEELKEESPPPQPSDAQHVEPREGDEAPATTTAEGATPAAGAPPPPPFLKGELTRFGDVQLLNRRSSFGVGIGAAGIDGVYYAVLRPDVNVHWGPFAIGLGAPLRFEVLDTNELNVIDPSTYETMWAETGRFRTEDWDQIEDFLRPLRYLTWGRKEDRFYLDLNRVHALTLGHGQVVRRYSPTVDIDEDNLFAAVDGYADFGGVELIAGPFPVPRLVGGLLFVKPLGLFLDDYVSKSLSFGVTYVTDLNAPTELVTVPNLADNRPQLPVDDAGDFLYEKKGAFYGNQVHGFGLDGEVKVVRWQFADVKLYGDWSQLVLPGVPEQGVEPFTDGGFTLGSLVRMSFGATPVRELDDEEEDVRLGKTPREMRAEHAVRLRVEGRAFGPRYLPSYFDTLYEADKWQLGFGSAPPAGRAALPTKIAYLAAQEGEPFRVGGYLELSYAWVEWIGITLLYEDALALDGGFVPAARNFAIHAETGKGVRWLQLFATYHYRHFEDFTKIFQLGTENEVLYVGARLTPLPILSINLGVQKAFRVGFTDDDLPGQKRPLPGQGPESARYRYTSLGLTNSWAGTLDVELGWQF